MAGFTNDGDILSGVDSQVEALEDPLMKASWVAEPYTFEFDLALETFRYGLLRAEIGSHNIDLRWDAHDREDLHSGTLGFSGVRAHSHGRRSAHQTENEQEHGDEHWSILGVLIFRVSFVKLSACKVEDGKDEVGHACRDTKGNSEEFGLLGVNCYFGLVYTIKFLHENLIVTERSDSLVVCNRVRGKNLALFLFIRDIIFALCFFATNSLLHIGFLLQGSTDQHNWSNTDTNQSHWP